MKEKVSIVVTSIFQPNTALRELARGANQSGWDFIIVGDTKSPSDFHLDGARFFDLETQKKFNFKLASLCPTGHYTRKNLGYLRAIMDGSSIIVETDDDNLPTEGFWQPRQRVLETTQLQGKGWLNVYSLFSDTAIWPRGLPLENVLSNNKFEIDKNCIAKSSPIQQGLANGNPDVDAIFRMTQTLPVDFKNREHPIRLGRGLWSPFNSQNTTWFKEAFPLLYLPSFCSFRMTDIWRSFVAQRISWECGWELTFHNATVYQHRNEHNLLRDFEQEVPGYLLNNKIKSILEEVPLLSGTDQIAHNLRQCYRMLVKQGIIDSSKELDLLEAWLDDIAQFS